jgi:hypothetical protein
MAIVRTVLGRKGLVQPQNGAVWNADGDANWALLDANYQDAADVNALITAAGIVKNLVSDLGINGVYSGFALAVGAGLIPTVAIGIAWANNTRYAPGAPPVLPIMPASQTRYLYYNASTGFYYNAAIGPTTPGDAYIGKVVSGVATITSVTNATPEGGIITATAGAGGGNFSVAHNMGRIPTRYYLRPTSLGIIAEQAAPDNTNLYLQGSDSAVSAKVELW